MFELYGIDKEYDCYVDRYYSVSVLLATFSSQDRARAYVEAATLSWDEREDKRRPYHSKSLLGPFEAHEIREGSGIPHDPPAN